MPSSPPTTLTDPTRPDERLHVVDVLRGVALAGILVANFAEITKAHGAVDRAVERLLTLLVTGSFYPLFAMLFGFGFVLQFTRWDARGSPAVRLYLRRVVGLFLFGLAIWCLLNAWWTLLQYAVAALALLPFRRAGVRTLLISAAITYAIVMFALPQIRPALSESQREARRENHQRVEQLKREGSYPALVAARARVIVSFLTEPQWYMGPGIGPLALFLVGAAIARGRILENPGPYPARLRRLMLWGTLLGIAANIMWLWRSETNADDSGVIGEIAYVAGDLGDVALGFAYGAAVILLYASGKWRALLTSLACVGRTALSNVVLQWLLISTLLFGYGFGLIDHIGPALCVLLSIPIFAVELSLSRWWLARYRFGPLEWIWRAVTYGHFPRIGQ